MERLFGQETEYAFAALGPGGARLPDEAPVHRFVDAAGRRLPHLPGLGHGIFLVNGARFYLDCGLHPELTTPECANPWDVVRYTLAGERLLAEAAADFVAHDGETWEVLLLKCNVDYSGTRSTWGCHESYLHRADPADLAREIIPHLVSRIIYTGAGGFNPVSDDIEFVLSPRVFHIPQVISSGSTHDRGIFHTKDEPLCGDGYRRLHLICGDSVCSHIAAWLRVATTALVVALVEGGRHPGKAVALRAPVKALQAFARDPQCRVPVKSARGEDLTALMIQRHYLEQAEANVRRPFMPPWAEEACRQWRAILDRLEDAPESVSATLDWAIKWRLYRDYLARRGHPAETLPLWNEALARTRTALKASDGPSPPIAVDLLADSVGPVTDEVSRLEAVLAGRRCGSTDLPEFLELRGQLFELDTKFGQLGQQGIFTMLDQAGVLTHRFPGVDNIEHAMANPPAIGRARVRGECIHRLAGSDRYICDWQAVWDLEAGTELDLSDPFETQEHWKTESSLAAAMTFGADAGGPIPGLLGRLRRIADPVARHARRRLGYSSLEGCETLLDQAYAAYERGDFERARQILNSSSTARQRRFLLGINRFVGYAAWTEARRGHSREALAVVNEYVAAYGARDDTPRDYVVVYRFQGLAPLHPEIWTWIRQGDGCVDRRRWAPTVTADFLAHKGYVLARTGSLREGASVLRRACEIDSVDFVLPRMRARLMADFADVLRILGERDEAATWLNRAEEIHANHDYLGERADHVLNCRAKLEPDRERAVALLELAAGAQRRLKNRVALVRTLLLQARLSTDPAVIERLRRRIVRLRRQVPDLENCPRLAHILARWNEWTCGAVGAENGDYFWLV